MVAGGWVSALRACPVDLSNDGLAEERHFFHLANCRYNAVFRRVELCVESNDSTDGHCGNFVFLGAVLQRTRLVKRRLQVIACLNQRQQLLEKRFIQRV